MVGSGYNVIVVELFGRTFSYVRSSIVNVGGVMSCGCSDYWCRCCRSVNSKLLAESGKTVTLVSRRREQIDELNAKYLTRVNVDGTKTEQKVASTTNLMELSQQDLIVIAVKYGQLQELYGQLSALPSTVSLLFMQNGLAHFDEALRLPQKYCLLLCVIWCSNDRSGNCKT